MWKWIKSLFTSSASDLQGYEFELWKKKARQYNIWLNEQRKLDEEPMVRMLSVTHTPKRINTSVSYKEWLDNCRRVDELLSHLRRKHKKHLRRVA